MFPMTTDKTPSFDCPPSSGDDTGTSTAFQSKVAWVSEGYTSSSDEEIVPFGNVPFSSGSGYDSSTYQFTAPSSGTYYFSFTLSSGPIDAFGQYYFFKNGANFSTRSAQTSALKGVGMRKTTDLPVELLTRSNI